ncbi:amino acid permease [Allobranchiibius sp. GilTou73]|uniref:amino acid permease n=1 Tax=Allobranchiibius sp. GilTou73 TaxID=2904523 RepID=UPI001F24EACB|nr:amino acid permease [Allobranchiibius sp. GilTou73]UIJ34839.1 amino acid permease [Allobranchiibius sp. GilTou73]
MADDAAPLSDDDALLATLGYKQELSRSWSSFSNFAISFSIISILAGCFTTFGQAWNNGGPVAISWGWPIISAFILIIGLTMSELVSAYPTSGGIYWWASKMGGPGAGFFTGWLNLIGLLAVTASVGYGAATFLDLTLDTMSASWAKHSGLKTVFVLFVVIMVLAALANIFSGHLLAVLNNISVWWHVAGAAIIIAVLIIIPDKHQSASFVFTDRINNSGYADNKYWFLVMPLGLLLTQYTITGFDASAHLSEETQGAAKGAAQGIWRSIFYSAIGGYVLLLAFVFAVQDPKAVTKGGGAVDLIFGQALPQKWHVLILVISTAGQLFCATACLTSASRMTFAFSRDRGIPGSRLLSKVNPRTRIPANAVVFVTVIGILITLPALVEVDVNGAPVPVAFYAVTSVAVIGLYLAFAIPIFLRWRMRDGFEPGSWTLGSKYKWMNIVAVAEIAVICVYFILPFTPTAIPGNKGFSFKYVNYAPVLTIGSLVILAIWWFASARHWFTGPKHTIDEAVTEAFEG